MLADIHDMAVTRNEISQHSQGRPPDPGYYNSILSLCLCTPINLSSCK